MYNYFLKKKLKKIYRENSRERHFLNWKDIHTVLVMFDTAHFIEAFVFIDQLKQLGKKVTVYAYQKKKDKQDYSNRGYRIISEKEASKWFNNPIRTMIRELKEETFDAVIDLTIRQNIPLEYVLAHVSASVKTGFKKNDFPQYDLAITTIPVGDAENFQVKELGRQIVNYLDQIQAG